MAIGQTVSAPVPASVERLLKQLVVTLKAVLLYPPASSIPRENADEAIAAARLARAVFLAERSWSPPPLPS